MQQKIGDLLNAIYAEIHSAKTEYKDDYINDARATALIWCINNIDEYIVTYNGVDKKVKDVLTQERIGRMRMPFAQGLAQYRVMVAKAMSQCDKKQLSAELEVHYSQIGSLMLGKKVPHKCLRYFECFVDENKFDKYFVKGADKDIAAVYTSLRNYLTECVRNEIMACRARVDMNVSAEEFCRRDSSVKETKITQDVARNQLITTRFMEYNAMFAQMTKSAKFDDAKEKIQGWVVGQMLEGFSALITELVDLSDKQKGIECVRAVQHAIGNSAYKKDKYEHIVRRFRNFMDAECIMSKISANKVMVHDIGSLSQIREAVDRLAPVSVMICHDKLVRFEQLVEKGATKDEFMQI